MGCNLNSDQQDNNLPQINVRIVRNFDQEIPTEMIVTSSGISERIARVAQLHSFSSLILLCIVHAEDREASCFILASDREKLLIGTRTNRPFPCLKKKKKKKKKKVLCVDT